jgi:hypothetical protein
MGDNTYYRLQSCSDHGRATYRDLLEMLLDIEATDDRWLDQRAVIYVSGGEAQLENMKAGTGCANFRTLVAAWREDGDGPPRMVTPCNRKTLTNNVPAADSQLLIGC